MSDIVRIGVIKTGCIATSSLLEFFLDERAERNDIDVRVVGSGAKTRLVQCKEVAQLMMKQVVNVVILIGPAQATRGPTEVRRILSSSGIPTIVISDTPAKKISKEMEEEGLGYIIVEADSMIGARREYLDPIEVALYNSDVLRVLAITGTFNIIVEEIDKVIESAERNEKPEMPRLVIDGLRAVEAAGFSNPYAKSKALASYEIARLVSTITTKACFKTQDWNVYVPLVAMAHEMMRTAAKLADEAREIEKSNDSVQRRPHFNDGSLSKKKRLMEKPRRTD